MYFLQILLQVEGVSNLSPTQRYGSFRHAIWRINQTEGFKVNLLQSAAVWHASGGFEGAMAPAGLLQGQWSKRIAAVA